MKTNRYRFGVIGLVTRATKYNPELGVYVNHATLNDDDFLVRLTNGTLTIPQQAAHSQEIFESHVSEEWIVEITRSFQPHAELKTTVLNWKNLFTLFQQK